MAGTINLRKGSSSAEPVAYPCATADLAALIGTTLTDVTVSSYSLTAPPGYTGSDLTAYKILIGDNAEVTTFFADLIQASQRTLQPVYFETVSDWRTNFEQVALTAEPDDWGGNVNPSNQHYYYAYNSNLDFMSLCPNYQMPFAPGTYYKNTTLSNYFYTDNDGWFILNLHMLFDVYNNKQALCFDYGNWWTYYWTADPRQIYDGKAKMPGMSGTVVWNIPNGSTFQYWIPGNAFSPYTPNPTDLPEVWTQFVTGEYNGVTYVGWMCYFKTPEGLFDNGVLYLIPQWFFGDITPTPTGGYWGPPSSTGGGSGSYTDTNDTPGMPAAPPNLFAIFTGSDYGVHMYYVNDTASWNDFEAALWTSSGSLWTNWATYKFNPIAGVVGCHFLPSAFIPSTSSMQTDSSVRLAGTNVGVSNYVYDLAPFQYCDYDVGSVSLAEYFGTAMDYSPHTDLRLYLPFCGMVQLDANRCIGGTISVKYRCDCMTGNVCAYVFLTDRSGETTALVTATGNCAISIPITGNDNGVGQVVGSLGSAIMGAITGLATGNYVGAAGAALHGAAGIASARHNTQITGSVSASAAIISPMQCRIEVLRPCVSTPDLGTDLRGRPADISVQQISDLTGTGFASFSDVHPDIAGATAAECAEIERLLHEGVIL